MSIRWKVLAAFLLTAIPPLIAMGWFAEFITYRADQDRLLVQMDGFAKLQAIRLGDTFEDQTDKLALVASRTQMRLTLAEHLESPAASHVARIERILGDALESIPDYRRISIAGPDGVVVASTDAGHRGTEIPMAGEGFRRALDGESSFELEAVPATDGGEELILVLYGPLGLEGRTIGVAVVQSDLADARTVLAGASAFADGGHTRLVSRGPGVPRCLVPLEPPGQPVGLSTPEGSDLLDLDEAEWSGVCRDETSGSKMLVASTPLLVENSGQLAVVTDIEQSVALAPARHLVVFGRLMALVGAGATLAVALFLTRALTRPLRYLAGAASRIAGGDLEARAEIASSDEIGALAKDFNAMAEAVREASRDLEAKVEDRSQQLRSAQNLLIQADKLESLGRLAAGIAHEVRNPLFVIQNGLDYFDMQPGESIDDDTRTMLGRMREAVGRADEIVGGMLELSRSDELSFALCDLNTLVRAALVLLHHRIKESHATLHLDLADDLPDVSIDFRKMEQVVINLVDNALSAMDESGDLWIRTYKERLDHVYRDEGLRTFERLRDDETVAIIEVRNTGPRIPREDFRKLFDPFFTTKASGEGTGLGLAVSRTIVELHHGGIELSNVKDPKGVRARILLKLSDDPATLQSRGGGDEE